MVSVLTVQPGGVHDVVRSTLWVMIWEQVEKQRQLAESIKWTATMPEVPQAMMHASRVVPTAVEEAAVLGSQSPFVTGEQAEIATLSV